MWSDGQHSLVGPSGLIVNLCQTFRDVEDVAEVLSLRSGLFSSVYPKLFVERSFQYHPRWSSVERAEGQGSEPSEALC